jgi:hypothetical protein
MIWIFGDSFATSIDSESWVSNIGEITNFASNGSSEYRILKTYLDQQSIISKNDIVIFVHTSPSRIYLKNDKTISSRTLNTHGKCDIIFNCLIGKYEKLYIWYNRALL